MTFEEFDDLIKKELSIGGGPDFMPSVDEANAMFMWRVVLIRTSNYPAGIEWVVEQGEPAVYAKMQTFRRRLSARGASVAEAVCRCVAQMYGWRIDERETTKA